MNIRKAFGVCDFSSRKLTNFAKLRCFMLLAFVLLLVGAETVFPTRKTVEDNIAEYNNTYNKKHEAIKPEVQHPRPQQTTVIVITPTIHPKTSRGQVLVYANSSTCSLHEEHSWYAALRRVDWIEILRRIYEDVASFMSKIEFIHVMTVLAIISAYVMKPVEVLREQHLVTHIR